MTAYWLATYREVSDPTKVEAYAKIADPALVAAGGTFLARGLPMQIYEAGENQGTVIIAFDSVEAAQRAHDSAAYRDAVTALDGGAVRDIRILPGVD